MKILMIIFFRCIDKKDTFYFVHSFMCEPDDIQNILYKVNHDGINLTAMVGIENVYGCQFHPEKVEVWIKTFEQFFEIKISYEKIKNLFVYLNTDILSAMKI